MLRHSRLLPFAAAFLAAAAAAQSPAPASCCVGPGTPAAPLAYRSPLAGYKTFTGENVVSWTEANETVGRIGGWREYARESAQPSAPPGRPATTSPSTGARGEAVPANPGATPGGSAPPPAPAPAAGHGGHQH